MDAAKTQTDEVKRINGKIRDLFGLLDPRGQRQEFLGADAPSDTTEILLDVITIEVKALLHDTESGRREKSKHGRVIKDVGKHQTKREKLEVENRMLELTNGVLEKENARLRKRRKAW